MTLAATTTARDFAESNSIPVGTVRTRLRKSTVEPVEQLTSSGRAHVYRVEDIERAMQQFASNPRVAASKSSTGSSTGATRTAKTTQSVSQVDRAETLVETFCSAQNMPPEQFRLIAVALVDRYMGA